MSYDMINKIVRQKDGRIIYSTGFGLTTIEPTRGIPSDELAAARTKIQQMDAVAHNWKR